MSEHRTSHTKATTAICHPTDDPKDRFLLQNFEIQCQACGGTYHLQVVGHHIPMILKALQQTLETYPDLCKELVTELPEGTTLVIPLGLRKQ